MQVPMIRRCALLVVLVLATVGAYQGVRECAFVGFDDDLYVYENPHVREGLTPEGVRWAFSAIHASTWQPLVWLSYMVDAHRYGEDPEGYHLTNLLLHLGSVLLLFLAWSALAGNPWRAALVAGLLALHPVHVESVAWVAERKDVLCALFWWAAIWLYAGYARRGGVWRAVGVGVCFVLALMSKPMALTLPAVLLLLDVWPLGRFQVHPRRCLIEKACLLPLSLASAALTYHAQSVGGSVLGVDVIPLWGRLSNALVSPARYLGKLLWPDPLALLYPHPGGWGWLPTLGGAGLIVVAVAMAWRLRHRFPALLFGLCWFAGTLLPVIGLVQIGWHAMADRFLYIPAVGLYVALAWSLPCPSGVVRRRVLIGACCVWLVVLGGCTVRQVARWRDNVTLFSHAVAVTSGNWVMENCLGAALVRVGRVEAALPHFDRAIAIRPDRPRAYYNRGCALMDLGRPGEAASSFGQALERWPGHVKSQYNRAVALTGAGDPEQAAGVYEQLLGQVPDHLAAMNNLAALYRRAGRLDEAIVLLRRAIGLAPEYAAARYNLGVFLLEAGEAAEAARLFAELLREDPAHAGAREGLRMALGRLQQSGD